LGTGDRVTQRVLRGEDGNFKNQIAKCKTEIGQAPYARVFSVQTYGYRGESKKGQYAKGGSKTTWFWNIKSPRIYEDSE